MANFKTHMQYAALGSGAGATLLLQSGVLKPQEAFLCWIAGTIGGLLPDVDSDNSHSLSIVFGLFSIVACSITVVTTINQWPLVWVWLSAAAVYLVIQYGVRYLFEMFTRHRGSFHSVLAGLLFGLMTVAVAGVVGATSKAAWFYGLFVFAGYLIHLLLDEAYAVDFSNSGIKRSLGSAFKFFDYKNIKMSVLMIAAVVGVFFLTPSHDDFLDIVADKKTYTNIVASITPEER